MNLLAVDIGGTKTRIGIYTFENRINKLYQMNYKSKEWNSFDQILDDFFIKLPEKISRPIYGCIAAAGKEECGTIKPTNLTWVLNKDQLKRTANLKQLMLINDFRVLVYGIPFLEENQYVKVQEPKEPRNTKDKVNNLFAIIGAGTGLGIARGLSTPSGIYALPSEGGHQEFSPRTTEEWELTNWLKKDLRINRISIERVISGNGLGNIARWRLMKEDSRSHPLRETAEEWAINKSIELPELISSFAKNDDTISKEVIKMWLSAYGSAAGDLALQELCTSGLWICGGTAPKHLKGISSMSFQAAFTNKGRFESYLNEIPVMALVDPEFGLFSAACKAHMIAESDVKLSK